jgi:hypothetical protein
MQTLTYLDKQTWGDGPWQTEPDLAHWLDADTGYACLVMRNQLFGHLCGYVGVPMQHPLAWRPYDDYVPYNGDQQTVSPIAAPWIDLMIHALDDEVPDTHVSLSLSLSVHGGITYANVWDADQWQRCFGKQCQWSHLFPNGVPDCWYFGFDCNHFDDFPPAKRTYMQQCGLPKWLVDAPPFDGEAYRDWEYVCREVNLLVAQLHALESLPPHAIIPNPHRTNRPRNKNPKT